MKTQTLKLCKITTTAGTQIRAKIDDDTVDQYAEAMLDATNKFPPVVVFHDGNQYILADGFHRVIAASRNGFTDIEAQIEKGTRADALKFALGANSTHGLKRTNADKRRSVELALTEWPKMADLEIAKICAVDNHTVASVRRDMETTREIPKLETRIGADGKERKMPVKKQSQSKEKDGCDEAGFANDPEPGEDDTIPLPPEMEEKPHTQDAAWMKAIGQTVAVNFFASQVEDIAEYAIAHATLEQLMSLKGELDIASKKVWKAITAKKQESK